MFVVAEDFVWRPPVQVGQGCTASLDLQQLRREAARGPFPAHALQAFPGSAANRGRDVLTGEPGKLARGLLSCAVLDVEWHLNKLQGRISLERKIAECGATR